jgi:hypothetical protein
VPLIAETGHEQVSINDAVVSELSSMGFVYERSVRAQELCPPDVLKPDDAYPLFRVVLRLETASKRPVAARFGDA